MQVGSVLQSVFLSDMAAQSDAQQHNELMERMSTPEFLSFERWVDATPDWFAYAVMVIQSSRGLRNLSNLARP